MKDDNIGAITVIMGNSGEGRTLWLREFINSSAVPTALLTTNFVELVRIESPHYAELLTEVPDYSSNPERVRKWVAEGRFERFAIDDLRTFMQVFKDELYPLDLFPSGAEIIIAVEQPESLILDHFDPLKLSRRKLSDRVMVLKQVISHYDVESNTYSHRVIGG